MVVSSARRIGDGMFNMEPGKAQGVGGLELGALHAEPQLVYSTFFIFAYANILG